MIEGIEEANHVLRRMRTSDTSRPAVLSQLRAPRLAGRRPRSSGPIALLLHARPSPRSVFIDSLDRLRRLDALRLAHHHVHLSWISGQLLRPLEPRAMERTLR